MCESIGAALEQECQMRYYERECPELLNFLKKKYWHKASGTQQKFVNIRRAMNNNGHVWVHWDRSVRVKLGNWLLDCVCNASGWFTEQVFQLAVDDFNVRQRRFGLTGEQVSVSHS